MTVLDHALAGLLLSMRVVPALAFAQPFSLLRSPPIVRVLLGVGVGVWLAAGGTPSTIDLGDPATLMPAAAGELLIGLGVALALQLPFAALLTVGRAIDIQAGFGLAMLLDPATRSQLPLVGTVFVYAAAAVFFAGSGPADLFALWSRSTVDLPLGGGVAPDPVALAGLMSMTLFVGFGLGGAVVLALFLTDLAIAAISRTLPQMNVMLLGFQVKALVTLALLPVALAGSASLLLRLLRVALDGQPLVVPA